MRQWEVRYGINSCILFLQRARIARTFRYCVLTNKDTIVRFSASGRTILLVTVTRFGKSTGTEMNISSNVNGNGNW